MSSSRAALLLALCTIARAAPRGFTADHGSDVSRGNIHQPAPAIVAVVGVVLMAVLLALCASKPKRNEQDVKMDQDTSLRTVRDRSATIAMETNPLFRSQNSHASVVAVAIPVLTADADEDELANAGGLTALENERRTTMYRMMMEEERQKKQKSKKASSTPAFSSSTAGSALQLDSAHPIWLHVGLTKPFAEQMLLLKPAPGLFLIRTKKVESGQYALSYVSGEGGRLAVLHHAITRSPLGDFLLDSRTLPGEPRKLEEVVALLQARNHFIQGQLSQGVAEIRDAANVQDQPKPDAGDDDQDA